MADRDLRNVPSGLPYGDEHVEGEQDEQAPIRRLTQEEARALVAQSTTVSPWGVVAVQAGAGLLIALLAWWVTGKTNVWWSALYGAATVVVPSALMARGISGRRVEQVAPGARFARFMTWEVVKLGGSVVMLLLANRIVASLSWPALFAGLVAGTKAYWLALLWRQRRRVEST